MNTTTLSFQSNRVGDILRRFHQDLDEHYGRGEVSTFCQMLFEAFLGWDRLRLLTSHQQTINQSDLLRLHWALEDLRRHRPIQHIIGHTDFCGCRIAVGPEVLIPRPETEEMVMQTLHHTGSATAPLTVVDLCTGSGCIAIAIAKQLPASQVTGIDISPAALALARRNAANNQVAVDFVQDDLLDPDIVQRHPHSADLIVCNPPYVADAERQQMQPNVLDHEPALALFVPDDDPLRFYRALADVAWQWLKPGGNLVAEINEHYGAATLQLFIRRGFSGALERDFRGKERVVRLVKPE